MVGHDDGRSAAHGGKVTQSRTFLVLGLFAILAYFLFGKRTAIASRVTGYGRVLTDPLDPLDPVNSGCGPYWQMDGDWYVGQRGERAPVIRDAFGPLAAPPNPPDWPPICMEV